ncbi:uncharacterized protein PGTG_22543 [Puccinia graminis f. sp. tritici CRL 75-36-700-3]|uniref:Uncharacterized protein n=1 Tax=Puccinia graminis f. sp. tritici (strain CRL 75-36-700-3 / race SCCL) TaxID=418459 RepID=H6QUV3_PUCGT|nr:uncharacterized protein PGTG_22543 [Puccinia graminis f. sp. tritici CRL 75-36-700-3]EHS64861.1 hypothetical protein PGTG_22543 [Puccinia graminis f. sp. tritici CRL 75-36-700-3]
MDNLLQWLDDNDDVLASLQTTMALILKTNQKRNVVVQHLEEGKFTGITFKDTSNFTTITLPRTVFIPTTSSIANSGCAGVFSSKLLKILKQPIDTSNKSKTQLEGLGFWLFKKALQPCGC